MSGYNNAHTRNVLPNGHCRFGAQQITRSPAPGIPSRNAARRTPSASSLSGCLVMVRRLWKRDRNAHKEPSTVEIAANRMPLVAKDSDADNSVEMPQNGHAVATAKANGNRVSPYAFERPAPPESVVYI